MSEDGNPQIKLNIHKEEGETLSAGGTDREQLNENINACEGPDSVNNGPESLNSKEFSTHESKAPLSCLSRVIAASAIGFLLIAFAISNMMGGTNDGAEISHGFKAMKRTQTSDNFVNAIVYENVKVKTRATKKNTEGDWRRIQLAQRERIAEIQNELRKPLGKVGFLRSSKLLLELRELRGFHDLDSILQMAECELQLVRGKEDESIRRVRDFISSSESHSDKFLIGLADELKKNNRSVGALLLYRVSNDLLRSRHASPDDAVAWLQYAICEVSGTANPLIKAGSRSREIGIKYGLKHAENMLNELRTIVSASPEHYALAEAKSLLAISITCFTASFYQKTIGFSKEGVSILENQFGVNTSNKSAYGVLTHLLGMVHHLLGEYAEAKRYYQRALKMLEKASDFNNENEKLNFIEIVKNNLKGI